LAAFQSLSSKGISALAEDFDCLAIQGVVISGLSGKDHSIPGSDLGKLIIFIINQDLTYYNKPPA